MGLSAYCTHPCQRDFGQNSAKESTEHIFCFYWNLASIAILFLLRLQHLQIPFVLTNQFGPEKNFEDLISYCKGEGSFFFNYAGPDC